jgi:exosome complex component RRP41
VKTAPFAPSADRRVTNASVDRRLVEQSHQIKRAMEAAILLHLFPKSKIEITVWVLADDGGRLPAAINATTLALMNAGIPIKDMVCSCSAGIGSGGVTLVDLNKREESSWGGQSAVYLPCAILPQRGTVVLAQCEARLPGLKELEHVLEAAMEGCHAVAQHLQAAIRERATNLLTTRSGQVSRIENAYPSSSNA